MRYSKRVHDNIMWKEVELLDEDVEKIQRTHEAMSSAILKKCFEEFPKNPDRAIVVFNKRCPTFLELLNIYLENRATLVVKHSKKVSKLNESWADCPKCGAKVKEGYRPGYKFWCGKCGKWKVPINYDEVPKEVNGTLGS